MSVNTQAAFRSYIDVLLDHLQAHGDETVLRFQRESMTGRALRSAIFRYARALAALDIGRGSLVALFAPNCPDALAIRYAANLLGATAMFLPAIKGAERRAAMLARIKPTLLVAFAETVYLVPETVQARVAFIGIGPASSRLDKLAATQSDTPMQSRGMRDDIAVIVSSGGTTGVPKGSRRSFAAYSALVCAARDVHRRQLINGPLAYLSQVLADTTLIGGGTVVLERRYDAADTLATIESEGITDLFLVEPQLFETMDHADLRLRDLSSLRSITHIGGSAPAVLRRRAQKRFGAVLTHAYGASETGLVSVLSAAEYAEHDYCTGRVRPGVDIRFRRANGTFARAGEHGSIEMKSAAIAQSYLNQPVESARKFRDGWCVTGDVGFIDEQRNLQVLGRASDIAEVDGRATGPAQIENVLCAMPDVRYAVAFCAANEPGWTVAVEPWKGKRIDVTRCVNLLKAMFGNAIGNAMSIEPMDRIPLTEQGKVDRTAIEALKEHHDIRLALVA